MCHVMNVTVTQLYDGACRAGAQRKRSHRDMRSQIAQFNGEPDSARSTFLNISIIVPT